MMADVVIPCRNEGRTVAEIALTFAQHPFVEQVIVVVDAPFKDDSLDRLKDIHPRVGWLLGDGSGKGQAVKTGLDFVNTERVIFCDADVTGLTHSHVTRLTTYNPGMVLGIPDWPPLLNLPLVQSWPWVTGQRAVPTKLAKSLDLHGYLMEVQLNNAARKAKLPIHFEWLAGLNAPMRLTHERIREMERDRKWGEENGVL